VSSSIACLNYFLAIPFFFYYFAVILLLGAEVNAFFAEDIRVTPDNVAAMIHGLTSHLPTNEQAMQQQASASHKDVEPTNSHSVIK
jgi:membrane protein